MSIIREFDWAKAKAELGHVLWIGGGSNGGKSTISKRLADEFGLKYYDGDKHVLKHMELATKDRSAVLWEAQRHIEKGDFWEWVSSKTAQELMRFFLDGGREDMELAVQDLLSLPTDKNIVMDVFGTHPKLLTKVAESGSIIFLISTDSFQREIIENDASVNGTEPDENYIEAQRLFSERVRKEAKRLDIPVIVSGGELSLDETYAAVCQYFDLRSG